jgi:hypothetical protein
VQLETRERNRQLMAQQGPQIEAIKQKFGGVKPFYDMARDLEQESQVNPGHAAARLQQQIAMGHQEAAGMAAASQVLASHDRASRAPAAIRQVAGQLLSDPRIFDGDLVSRDGAGALDTALDLAEAITAAETTGKDRVAGLDAAVRQAWTGNPLAGLPDEALMKFAQTDFGGMWGARQEVDAFSREHPDISQARWDAMAAGLAGGKF